MLVPICQFLMIFGLLILYCKILHSCDSSLIGPPVELTESRTPLNRGAMSEPGDSPNLVCCCATEHDQPAAAALQGKSPNERHGSVDQSKQRIDYSLSEMNKPNLLSFAEAAAYASSLAKKFMELEVEAEDALRCADLIDSNQQNRSNQLQLMLNTALLIDCLLIKILESADAHSSSTERRPVIQQVKQIDYRITSLIRQLDSAAVPGSKPSILDWARAGPRRNVCECVGEGSDVNVFARVGDSSNLNVYESGRESSNVSDSVRASSNVGDCAEPCSKVFCHVRARKDAGSSVRECPTISNSVCAGNVGVNGEPKGCSLGTCGSTASWGEKGK